MLAIYARCCWILDLFVGFRFLILCVHNIYGNISIYTQRALGCLASVFQSHLPFTGVTQLQTFFLVAEGVEQGWSYILPVWGLLFLDLFPNIVQWVAETWPAAMHLLSDRGSFCGLPLFSLSWSFHGEKLSSGTRMSVLDKGLSSVRFPRHQRTEAGHLFNLALGRAEIEQTSDKMLEPMSRPWIKIQLW